MNRAFFLRNSNLYTVPWTSYFRPLKKNSVLTIKSVLLFVFFILSATSFEQTIKVEAGTSLSKLDWKIKTKDLFIYSQRLLGYSVYVGIDYADKNNFSISSDIGMLRKGGQLRQPLQDANGMRFSNVTDEARLDYLSFNTCFNLRYPLPDMLVLYIKIGPRIDYLMSHSNEFDGIGMKSVSYGLTAGLGFKQYISKFQLGVRGDYLINFNKVADWPVEVQEVRYRLKL